MKTSNASRLFAIVVIALMVGSTNLGIFSVTAQTGMAQCADGLDNDGDNKIDLADPGCVSSADTNEYNSSGYSGFTAACANSLDDDGDGKTDLADPGCASTSDDNEYNATQGGSGFVYACSNGLDDDGDGKVDLADPGCVSSADDNEYNATQSSGFTAACANGLDDDADGKIDLNDPGCSSSADTNEFNSTSGGGGGFLAACSNGLDDDNDGKVDLNDPGCSSSADTNEINTTSGGSGFLPACANGLDDDGDGKIDLNDSGCTSSADDNEFSTTGGGSSFLPACADARDNDGDGKIDLNDPGCSSSADDNEFNTTGGGGFVAACGNGLDDDGDGKIDLNDPGCSSSADTNEFNTTSGGGFVAACGNGIDDDGDGKIDLADPGCATTGDTNEFNAAPQPGTIECNDGIDNDGDSKIDMNDPGCVSLQDTEEFNPTVTPPPPPPVQNRAPYFTSSPSTVANVAQTYQYDANAFDPDSDSLTYTLVTAPSGASINSITGLITWTPNSNQGNQSHPFTIRVADNRGGSATQTFSVFAQSIQTQTYQCNDGYDNDGDGRIDLNDLGCSSSVDDSEFNQVQQQYQCNDGIDNDGDGRVDLNDPGCSAYTDDSEYNDYGGGGVSNNAPYFTNLQANYYINVNQNLRFTVSAIDPDGSSVNLYATNLPQGASLYSLPSSYQQVIREFNWTPQSNQTGTQYVTFIATDSQGLSANKQVTITVSGGTNVNTCYDTYGNYICSTTNYQQNSNPYFTSSPSTVADAGATYIYDANAFDPNGDQITYALVTGPLGTYVNPTTGVLAWTAPAGSVGQTYSFSMSASDYRGGIAYQNFSVSVRGILATPPVYNPPVYTPPTYTPPPAVVTAKLTTFNIRVVSDENNNVIVSWDNNKPTRGEVVFGFTSQPDTKLLNYDATTGQSQEINTHHDMNLGQLQLRQTYYLRIISRTGSETDISSEMIVIPLPFNEGGAVVEGDGTASAFDSLGDFLTSGWFLLFLLLLILALVIYLLVARDREASPARQSFEIHS